MAPSHSTHDAAGQPGGDRPALVKLARDAIAHALGGPAPDVPKDEVFQRLAATFVTILLEGRVHGCIGALEPARTLADDIQHNAVAAALHDPRSRPLTSDDVPFMTVEVSVLSALEPVEVTSEEDAIKKLRPGIDGVVLRHGVARATFLPQVWEKLPDPRQFLAELRHKAGLGPWPPGLRMYRYTVQKYLDVPQQQAQEVSDVGSNETAPRSPLAHAR